MILSCNSCEKKFVVPDNAISANGRLVQCSSCGNKWTQFPIDNKTKPKVAKLSNSDIKNIDVLNLENVSDGITLDVLSYSPSGFVILSGRTLSNNELNIFKAEKDIGKTMSDEDGKWKFILEEHNLSDQKISIKTNINGEDVILSYNQAELKKRFVNKNY